ncbi:MAG: PIN domain-containing protein [Bryobacteraceae bacterium]
MIAADTSTWIAYLQGDSGEDVHLLDKALSGRLVVMVPAVLTEVLSDPKLPSQVADRLCQIPLLEPQPEYWQRAGALRARSLAKRRKARLGDALIAQSCLDRGVPLLTRDKDFRTFAESESLNLLVNLKTR